MDKTTALESINNSRRALLGAIDGLSRQELSQSNMVGEWSIRDLLAHIVGWDETMIRSLRDVLQGQPFWADTSLTSDEQNAVRVRLKSEMPLDILLNDLVMVREELLEVYQQLTPEQGQQVAEAPWGGQESIDQMISGLGDRENEHAAQIRRGFRAFYEDRRA